jgi:hypothetical protein
MNVNVCVSWALKLHTSASQCPTNSPCGGAGKPAGRAGSQLGSVLCDIAGTTIEDGGHGPVACDAALAACGTALSDDQRGTVRGASKREASAALVARPGAPVPRLAAAVSQRPHGREHGWERASGGGGTAV